MSDSAAAPDLTYKIAYQKFAGADYNLELRGDGTLEITTSGPTYVFSGQPRRLFARKPVRLTFDHDAIRNVVVQGRRVGFSTQQGKTGRAQKPFVFFCADDATAKAIAGLLPTQMDPDFATAQDFEAKLIGLNAEHSGPISVTTALLALNAAVFVAMGFLGAGWFEATDLMPYILYGANNGGATTGGEWWRLFTCMFMHFGLMHLVLNMWALFQVGQLVEKLLGRSLYSIAYIGSGLIASLTSVLWHGDKIWSAGASGAVFGIYGVLLGYMLREKHALPRPVYQPLIKSTLVFAAYNLVYGLVHPAIDNSAHIGGFVSGIALGWLMSLPLDIEVRRRALKSRGLAGAAMTLGVLAVGIACAPTYDYRIREEITWHQINQPFVTREPELLKHHQEGLSAQASNQSSDHTRFLEAELIPFYQDWLKQITAMPVTPKLHTARLQAGLANVFRLRLAAFRQLSAGLKAHDQDALNRYWEAEAKTTQLLAELKTP